MKITLLTVHSPNWKSLTDLTLPNWRAYCRKHGYDFIARSHKDSPDRFFNWLRFEDAYDYLHLYDMAEVMMLIDADTICTNPDIKIESLLVEDHDFYITKDANGLNAGVQIWRANNWSERFMFEVLELRNKHDGDQRAIEELLPRYMDRTKILPQSSMNSYINSEYMPSEQNAEGDWRENHFILHLPGLSMSRRIEILSGVLSERKAAA